jgi:RNA polymerase sigma factor (TIGR02999 family)
MHANTEPERSGELHDLADLDAFVPVVYEELRRLAHLQLVRARPGETLCTTALVHEAYVKLADGGTVAVRDRNHFFSLSARVMRQIVLDHARRRAAGKRGGGRGAPVHLLGVLEGGQVPVEGQARALVALDKALTRLESLDHRLVRVVELRFFAGLSVEEVADVLEISTATVKRDSQVARAFLVRELSAA